MSVVFRRIEKFPGGPWVATRPRVLPFCGSFLNPAVVAGCFNCRRFLDESLPHCSTTGRPIRGKMAKAVVDRNGFLLCISGAHENSVEQAK
jgi:hypothetical protein